MKNPSYTRKKKYENLVEPSRTSQARFSYFFSLLVISYQIFIIFQSPSQNWPLFHTFSVSLTKFAKLSSYYIYNPREYRVWHPLVVSSKLPICWINPYKWYLGWKRGSMCFNVMGLGFNPMPLGSSFEGKQKGLFVAI